MNNDPLKVSPPSAAVSDEALRWIVKLNSGTATTADRKQFAAWRQACHEHELAAQEAEALWGDAADLHQDSRSGIVRVGRREGKPSRRNVLGIAVTGAAGVALWSSGAFQEWFADYATGVGETRTFVLSDGSRLTLNARSVVNTRFSETARRLVLVQGQAFFEVAPDAARPFEVVIGDVTVAALGTAFDINRNLPNRVVAVSVAQHSVMVSAGASGVNPSQRLKLLEGQGVVVDARGHIGEAAKVSSDVAAWRSGLYVAEDRSLGEVISALQAYHPGWIVMRGDIGNRLRVNAVLNLKTPDESLLALANGLPISVRRLSPYLTVISDAH